jgi:hypothetical protein
MPQGPKNPLITCGTPVGVSAFARADTCDPRMCSAIWLLCMIVGAILAAIVRLLLVRTRLEPYLGPLTIFYPSLIAMFAMILWAIFFNRV